MVRSFSYQSYVLHVACQHTLAGGRGHEEWNGWGDEGGWRITSRYRCKKRMHTIKKHNVELAHMEYL